MHNTILASIEFYFKGIRHDLSAVIDMDACMRHDEEMQYIYHTLASENGIGLYSHELDVMILEDIEFSNPTGLVTDFFNEGELDIDGFGAAWKEQKVVNTLQPIAKKHLGIDKLDEHPDVKAALIAAFRAK